ncbi:MAG: GNAT family N-acetyltransferase [Rhodothalassiaceae bacterium]
MRDMMNGHAAETCVEPVTRLSSQELAQLVEATEQAIADKATNWTRSPGKSPLESFWKGILLAPHRDLFVARFEKRVVGALQLIRPGPLAETGAFSGELAGFFVAPHARGHSLARRLIEAGEARARGYGLKTLDFSIRADRQAALGLAAALGFQRWAVKSHFAFVDGRFVAGYFFTKELTPGPE